MPRLKLPRALTGVAALIALGALAWGIGWAAHSLFAGQAASQPTQTITPPPPPLSTYAPSSALPTLTSLAPRGALQPTSTLAPTSVPTPTANWEIVRAGEGVYKVCRRHCPGRWRADDVPPGLEEYAREVAEINDLSWGLWGPSLQEGQRMRMPPCP